MFCLGLMGFWFLVLLECSCFSFLFWLQKGSRFSFAMLSAVETIFHPIPRAAI